MAKEQVEWHCELTKAQYRDLWHVTPSYWPPRSDCVHSSTRTAESKDHRLQQPAVEWWSLPGYCLDSFWSASDTDRCCLAAVGLWLLLCPSAPTSTLLSMMSWNDSWPAIVLVVTLVNTQIMLVVTFDETPISYSCLHATTTLSCLLLEIFTCDTEADGQTENVYHYYNWHTCW